VQQKLVNARLGVRNAKGMQLRRDVYVVPLSNVVVRHRVRAVSSVSAGNMSDMLGQYRPHPPGAPPAGPTAGAQGTADTAGASAPAQTLSVALTYALILMLLPLWAIWLCSDSEVPLEVLPDGSTALFVFVAAQFTAAAHVTNGMQCVLLTNVGRILG